MAGFGVKILANIGALWVAARYIPGFDIVPVEFFRFAAFPISAAIQTLVVTGIALALANALLRPILKAVGAILPLVTGALLLVILNIILLYIGSHSLPVLAIDGLRPLLLGGLLLGIVNAVL